MNKNNISTSGSSKFGQQIFLPSKWPLEKVSVYAGFGCKAIGPDKKNSGPLDGNIKYIFF